MSQDQLSPVLLFDGECNLCNSSVRFILRYEKNNRLKFASLQSDFGKKMTKKQGINTLETDSIVFLEGDLYFIKSQAALKIAREMGGLWKYLSFLSYIPKRFSDWVYDLVANHRYKVFGKGECIIPSEEQKARFIDL